MKFHFGNTEKALLSLAAIIGLVACGGEQSPPPMAETAETVTFSSQADAGALAFGSSCAACHGVNAEGGISFALTGGEPLTNGIDTAKTIGNFWPYATTIFDYTRRAMPWMAPRTLTDDQVYALTAYLLALNGIIEDDDVMNADTLPQVQMPNRDGFIVRFPERTPR